MTLKHDAQGFLLGDPIDLQDAISQWKAIRADVRAILRALTTNEADGGTAPALAKLDESVQLQVPPATPWQGRQSGTPVAISSTATSPATPATQRGDRAADNFNVQVTATQKAVDPDTETKQGIQKLLQPTSRQVAAPRERDGRGRFLRNNAGEASETDADPSRMVAQNDFIDRLVQAIRDSSGEMQDVDPTIQAVNEVAQPMARGYELLTGGDSQKKQEGWLRRIHGTLSSTRNEQGLFNKVASKRLKAIEEKPIGMPVNNGILSSLMPLLAVLAGLLTKIPGMGALARIAGLLTGTSGLLKGAGSGGGPDVDIDVEGKRGRNTSGKVGRRGWLGKIGRRIPIIGALLGSAGAAAEIYDAETDDSLTRREKNQRAGQAVGGVAGSVGGMLAGAKLGAVAGAVAGPVGVAIGSVVGGIAGMFFGDQAGQILGTTVGGWVTDLRNADIPGKLNSSLTTTVEWIRNSWDSVVSGFSAVAEGISKSWGGFIDSAKSGWDAITSLASSAYEGLKSIPIIGSTFKVAETAFRKTIEQAKSTGTSIKEFAGKAIDAVKDGAQYLGEKTTIGKAVKAAVPIVSEQVKYGADVATDALRNIKSKTTGGQSSKQNKAMLLNQIALSGINDPKEQAMIMAQADHETGGFKNLTESFAYRSAEHVMDKSATARKRGKAAVAEALSKGPQAVAEIMYGGRRDLGNTSPGDGYKFRGRGHFQLTGRDNYTAASKDLGIDLVNNPDLAADPEISAKLAIRYWKKRPKMVAAARRGDVGKVSEILNGGDNGKAHRAKLYAKYSAEIGNGSIDKASIAAPVATNSGLAEKSVLTGTTTAAPTPSAASIAAPVATKAVTASVQIPTTPSTPIASVSHAEAPPVAMPLASSTRQQIVVAANRDVGQDLRERGIAHIATGGIGGT